MAERVAGLSSIREGGRRMVRASLLDMFHLLHQIRAGAEVAEEFLAVLRGFEDKGLLVDDDALYNKAPQVQSEAIPEFVAAAGLGPTGRVSVANSLWCRCVPTGLRAVYRRGIRRAGAPRRPPTAQGKQLHRMFELIHLVRNGVKPTAAPPSATAFVMSKSSTKCRCLLNATLIEDMDPRAPPKVRLPAVFEIRDLF